MKLFYYSGMHAMSATRKRLAMMQKQAALLSTNLKEAVASGNLNTKQSSLEFSFNKPAEPKSQMSVRFNVLGKIHEEWCEKMNEYAKEKNFKFNEEESD